jgi:hypothetical protein
LGAIRPNDLGREANGYGQAADDHARSRTDPDDAERPDRYLWIRRLGFVREMASKWHVPRSDEALVTQPD